jgi:protoporphyrin/coproporphyrin ferrochelatase
VIMPIGFTADHVETLFDIDIEMKREAEGSGLEFTRARCLNTESSVIEAMAAAIGKALTEPEGEGH